VGLKRFSLLVVLAAALSIVFVPGAGAGNFDEEKMGCMGDNPATCPAGTVGQPYSLTIYLAPPDSGRGEDFGCAQFFHSGGFPPGLTISDEGYITGTPTQAGTYDFYLTVKYHKEVSCDLTPKSDSDDRFILKINPGVPKLTLGPESTPVGTTGAPYSLQMTASVPDPKTWSISSGTLPPGLAINPSSGLIAGTPTAAGTYDFTVYAKVNADSRFDSKALEIVVRDPLTVSAGDPFDAQRAVGEVSVPFDGTISATGGFGTYTWAVTTGAVPPGLELVDGAITGTPTAAGSYAFVATVTDAEGRTASYTARIVIAPKLSISTLLLRAGKVGKLYGARLKTLGGMKPVSWRVSRGPLPRGVRFDRFTGTLTGFPKQAGRYRITFEATDALGVVSKRTFTVLVAPAPKPKVLP
jgi:large repetitive protein